MKPICPECGSIKVTVAGRHGVCLENDCGHKGSAGSFKNNRHHGAPCDAGNRHWRDPVALLPGGYKGQ